MVMSKRIYAVLLVFRRSESKRSMAGEGGVAEISQIYPLFIKCRTTPHERKRSVVL